MTASTAQYTYDLANLERPTADSGGSADAGAQARSGNTAIVSGSHAHVGRVRYAEGGGYPLTVRGAERFLYVMRGVLSVDIDGQLLRAGRGDVVHIPAGVAHAVTAIEGDADLLVAADTREPELDCAGSKSDRRATPQSSKRDGPQRRYVYTIDELNEVPEGVLSAEVTPKNFVSKKSSSYGAALKGEALQIGVIHKAQGSGAKLHTHPNEQFNVVLKGRVVGEIDGRDIDAPTGHLIHMPAGVVHRTFAGPESDITVFVVKDNRHGMAGPPVDGIEDGPQFLAGFGPHPGKTDR